MPENQIVLVNFTIFDQDSDDRAIYAKTAEKIVESIRAGDGGEFADDEEVGSCRQKRPAD